MLDLPEGCTVSVNGADVTSVDVGRCGGESCITSTDQSAGQCCGVVDYQELIATCATVSFAVNKAIQCGCSVCDVRNGITVSGQIYLVSLISDEEVLTIPTEAIFFIVGNSAHTSLPGGTFIFSVTQPVSFVAMIFPSSASDTYLPHVFSINLLSDVISYSITVKLPPKPAAVQMDPTVENAVFSGLTALSSTFTVIIPPNSWVYMDGSIVAEAVDVVVDFLKPTDPQDLALAPGGSIYIDTEGNHQLLRSYGIITIAAFTSSFGTRVILTGDVLLTLNSVALGLTPTEIDATSIWMLNLNMGIWQHPLSLSSSRRGKRQVGSDTSGTLSSSPIMTWNLAQTAFISRCQVSIVAYDSAGAAFVPGIQIHIITAGARLDFTTDSQGKVCGLVECGTDFVIFEPSGAYSPPYTGHCVPNTVTYQNDLSGDIVHIYSTADAASISALGPLYDSGECSVTTSANYDFNCNSDVNLHYHFQLQSIYPINLPAQGMSLLGAVISPSQPLYQGRVCFVRTEVLVSNSKPK